MFCFRYFDYVDPYRNYRVSVTKTQPTVEKRRNEPGESSMAFCDVCKKRKNKRKMFKHNSCYHSICSDCIEKHVAASIRESNIGKIKCPVSSCCGSIEPIFCRSLVPGEVFDRWENALSEAFVNASRRVYCPYEDCSELLLLDNYWCEMKAVSDCLRCRRMFCVRCEVAWHAGIDCREFQALNGGDDEMLMGLGKKRQRQRQRQRVLWSVLQSLYNCMFGKWKKKTKIM